MIRTIPTNHRLPVFAHDQVARTRADCISGAYATGSLEERLTGQRQCYQVACRHNLLAARSDERPGRRHDGLAPEWTVRGETSATAPSCVLDVALSGPRTSREIAKLCGVTTRRVEQLLKAAKEGAGGVDLARLVSVLMENGE